MQGLSYHSSLRDETGLGCLAKVRPEMAGDGAHSAHMALHMHPSGNTLAAAGEICPKRFQQLLDMSRHPSLISFTSFANSTLSALVHELDHLGGHPGNLWNVIAPADHKAGSSALQTLGTLQKLWQLCKALQGAWHPHRPLEHPLLLPTSCLA